MEEEKNKKKIKHIETSVATHQRIMLAKVKLGKKRVEDVILLGLELIESQLFPSE